MNLRSFFGACLLVALTGGPSASAQQQAALRLNDKAYFEAQGANVFVYNNFYGFFGDEKFSGIELIHHGVRTATNGDVRLSNTPGQWDPHPELVSKEPDASGNRMVVSLRYPAYDFAYRVEAEAQGAGVRVRVLLDQPVPEALQGRAGFNFEFLPSAYFGKTFLMDGQATLFPREAGGAMYRAPYGVLEAHPLATGATLVVAPEDPERRVMIEAKNGAQLAIYDGRNQVQNGWFVVRSLLPAGRTGAVLEWMITPNRVPNWTRPPMIAYSQAGYHPNQEKVAVIELDPTFQAPATATLYQTRPDGQVVKKLEGPATAWGQFLRYTYVRFDFSSVRDPGVYHIEYGGVRTGPVRIASDVFTNNLWQPSLDTFMPVQMDHMFVNDRYRVWHGAPHLDDALQAPLNEDHFDGWNQGPTTDTRFQPGEHIPGLNVGGWFDAGDFDIQTESQYQTVSALVLAYEMFDLDWDQTTVKQEHRYVDMRVPDGKPDALQQIEHGVLQLMAQQNAIGHTIPGINEAFLHQYTHLGDAVNKTDNRVYDPTLDSLEVRGDRSGTFDDRWAFTNRSPSLDYGATAALAAASRVLKGYDDSLATAALEMAERVWAREQNRPPAANADDRRGGWSRGAELTATVELLIATRNPTYARRVSELWPSMEQDLPAMSEGESRRFTFNLPAVVRALPYMDAAFRQQAEAAVRAYQQQQEEMAQQNPFRVPITTGNWAGSNQVMRSAMDNYILHKAFPEIVSADLTLNGLNYILGTHPYNNASMVSGVGAHSKTIAYGNNRADYTFIAGGIVPGVVVLKPDFPEMKLDWPFLWYEGEYIIREAPLFIFIANAAAELVNE